MTEKKLTKITMTPQASEWFQNEMHLKPGNGIKLFGKGYGETNAHQGFHKASAAVIIPLTPSLIKSSMAFITIFRPLTTGFSMVWTLRSTMTRRLMAH